MLIDATHPEETRVVVADGNKVEDFDFETISKKQIAGNIYLAKVTRVEPSLQAAFVEYGGNRHGFLAFSEIHPDYYQIPKADREALIAEEEEEARKRAAADEDRRAARQAAAAARAEAKAARDAAREDEDDEDEDEDDRETDDSDDEDDDYEAERPETVSEGEDDSAEDDDSDEDDSAADEDDAPRTREAVEAVHAEEAPAAETAAEAPKAGSDAETDPETAASEDSDASGGGGSSDDDEDGDDKDGGSPRVMAEAAGAGDEDDERVEEDYPPATRRPEDEAAAAETPAETPSAASAEAASEAPAEETPAETAETAPVEETPVEETPAETLTPEAEAAREIVAGVFADTPAEPVAEPEAPVAEAAPETPAEPVTDEAPAETPEVETAEAAPAEIPAEEAIPVAEAEASQKAETADDAETETEGQDASGDGDGEGDDASGDKRRRRSRRGGRSRRSRRGKGRDEGADDAPAEAKADKGDRSDKGDAQPSVDDGSDDDAASEVRDDGDDLGEGISARRIFQRRYKIQEVIKVRQILLVQVVKEERGNKGAALTTYLSLAGRYCVLMPNTARGGGISRKITNAADRKKLKDIAGDIEVPRGMGLIIRTAGAKRTAQEIERDYEYLLRQWERIRETTLRSVAPTLIYEEGSLIKRAIRDLYAQGIDQICVDGDEGYKEAKDYMSMLMPGHARNVVRHSDPQPLFAKHGVEQELASMFNPTVHLKSGGYIVIGVTEALVAIDINSGKSTKEGSIEDTALKTNLEAADEIARQLRLRDLAGLIVIDFIDMEDPRNNRAVEKRMKEKLKVDRARIQVGRISAFGLMEMSRQRLRPGVLEATTAPCAHCHGTGVVRADSSLALSILRQLEGEAARGRAPELAVRAPMGTASYLLNDKRDHLSGIEARHGVVIRVEGDPSLFSPEFHVERIKTASRLPLQGLVPAMDAPDLEEVEEAELVEAPAEEIPAPVARDEEPAEESREARSDRSESKDKDDDDGSRRRRGRRGGRRRRRGGDEEGADEKPAAPSAKESEADEAPAAPTQPETLMESDAPVEIPEPKRTRRRRKSKKAEDAEQTAASETSVEDAAPEQDAAPEPAPEPEETPEAAQPETAEAAPAEVEAPAETAAEAPAPEAEAEPVSEPAEAEPAPALEAASPAEDAPAPEAPAAEFEPVARSAAEEAAEAARPKKRGWWALKR
ncbi:ribonuclease E [Albimonas pacifica]|uniref:Ribonuclease E n=2 Tax=Albimonas pacifica TaxID=1114924 RepID=A0A1I3D5Z8_9RHOB|nr:ribonuclease E [Albimonas pacifica]